MADGKNKIIIYRDWLTTFEALQDEEAGKLVKHLFRYVNDLNPEPPDRLTALLFEPIKQALKRDLKRYEEICSKNKDNVSIRWQDKDTTEYERKDANTNYTDIDIDKDIDSKEENPPPLSSKKLLKKERNFEYLPLAKELSRIVSDTKHIEHTKTQLHQWTNDIRQLIENNKVSEERIKAGLQYLKEHAGEQYCPVIESGAALKKKFGSLEGQMKKPKDTPVKYQCPSNWRFGIDWEDGKEGCRKCEEYTPKIHSACVACYRNSRNND
jgi:hypothetical protein